MNRRIAARNRLEMKESDLTFVKKTLSEDAKVSSLRDQWLRDATKFRNKTEEN